MYFEKKYELQDRLDTLRNITIDDKKLIHMKDNFNSDFYIIKVLNSNNFLIDSILFNNYLLFTNLNRLLNEKFNCQYGSKKIVDKHYTVFLSKDKTSALKFAKFLKLILDKELKDVEDTLKSYEWLEKVLKN